MKSKKVNLVFSILFLIVFLPIMIAYFVIYIKLFIDTNRIDSSPQAAIEEYLNYETDEYKILNLTLKEEEFRQWIYDH